MWVMEFGTFAHVELKKKRSACAFYASDYWGRANVRGVPKFQPTHPCEYVCVQEWLKKLQWLYNWWFSRDTYSTKVQPSVWIKMKDSYIPFSLLSIIVCSGILKANSFQKSLYLTIRLYSFPVFTFQATPFNIHVYTPNDFTSSSTYSVFAWVQFTSRGCQPTVMEPRSIRSGTSLFSGQAPSLSLSNRTAPWGNSNDVTYCTTHWPYTIPRRFSVPRAYFECHYTGRHAMRNGRR